MNYYLLSIKLIQRIEFWICAWITLVTAYLISMQHGVFIKEWNSIIYGFQTIADISIGIFGFLAYKNSKNKIRKTFYFLIFLSLIPGLYANEIYNVLIYIIKIKKLTTNVNLFWVIAYSLFLIIQIISWSYLIIKKRDKFNKGTQLTKIPYIQAMVFLIFSLLAIVIFRRSILTEIGTAGVINSILETILFVFISVSLSRSKNEFLRYLETGFLLLIAFNLAHRFSYSTGYFVKTFDIAWLICLLIIIFGLFLSWQNSDEEINFFEANSIHVITSSVFLLFTTLIFMLFILVDFVISSIDLNTSATNLLPQNIPSILVFTYAISLLVSNFVSNYLSKPLEMIATRVDMISDNKFTREASSEKTIKIFEVDKLNDFILKTITQLKLANQTKSDFIMNMSHDFRTPASGILHLSKSIYKRIDDEKLKNLQALVIDSAEQLMKFFEDILNYSRLENGEFKVNAQKFYVDDLLNEVISFVLVKAEEKNLKLEKIIEGKVKEYLGDKVLINRIMINVVSNAIKFTHEGMITVSCSRETINASEWLVMRVKDTGIGIHEEDYELIFEPFTRVESSETSKYPGIGLGLSNVKLMLEKIKGHVTVESKIGVGSTFSIFLPFKHE